jgi:hypothetical protein
MSGRSARAHKFASTFRLPRSPAAGGGKVSRSTSLGKWFPPLAAILIGAELGLMLVTRSERVETENARIDVLEQQLAGLEAKAEVARILQGSGHSSGPSAAAAGFTLDCRAPWRELGPVGPGLWACRTAEPAPGGFFPNCNLTSAPLAAGESPELYYERAVESSAQLAAARQLGGRSLLVHGRLAYEASFEHDSTGTRLQVLTSLIADGERIYAITCSAPPASFDAVAPRFREIAASFELET